MKIGQLKQLINEILKQSLIVESKFDPTKEELLNFLGNIYGKQEGFKDDAEVAIYWFAHHNHSGQTSSLYSILSTSRYSPGPISNGPEKNSIEEMMYEDLVMEYGSEEEKKELQKKFSKNEELERDDDTSVEVGTHTVKGHTSIEVKSQVCEYEYEAEVTYLKKDNSISNIDSIIFTAAEPEYPNFDELDKSIQKKLGKLVSEEIHEEWPPMELQEGEEADYVNSQWDGHESELDNFEPKIRKSSGKILPKKQKTDASSMYRNFLASKSNKKSKYSR